MRLDKYLSQCAVCSRKECANAVKSGAVLINDIPALRADQPVDAQRDRVMFRGTAVVYCAHFYIMMNKPAGVVSATEDTKDTTVLQLLPENLRKKRLHPCGRLDKNTTGFVLLTDDGALSHALLSPRRHVEKEYAFTVKFPLRKAEVQQLEQGVDISEEKPTKPCKIRLDDPQHGIIVLTEGKYHQIKRMMECVHNQITSLRRISFAAIPLDPDLGPGEWRMLHEDEIAHLKRLAQLSAAPDTDTSSSEDA